MSVEKLSLKITRNSGIIAAVRPMYTRAICVGKIMRVSSLNNVTCSVENDPTDCGWQVDILIMVRS